MTAHAPQPGDSLANVLREGRVVGQWTCLRCRYHIANLKPDERCPECGESVALSLDPTLLRFAPPETLRRVRVGARTIVLSILVCAIAIPIIVFAINLIAIPWASGSSSSYIVDLFTGPIPVILLIYIMLFWFVRGVFLMTSKFPQTMRLPRSAAQLRWTVRPFAVLLPVIFAPLAYVITMESLGERTFFHSAPDVVPAAILGLLWGVAVALALGLSLYTWSIGAQTYLRGRPLRSFARAPSWFAVLCALLALFVLALVDLMRPSMQVDAWGVLQWAFVSSIIAGFAFLALTMLSSFIVVDALRSCMRRDEREARAAAHSAGGES